VLDSGAEGRIAAATLSGNSLRQTVYTHCASVHQAAKLLAALLRTARDYPQPCRLVQRRAFEREAFERVISARGVTALGAIPCRSVGA